MKKLILLLNLLTLLSCSKEIMTQSTPPEKVSLKQVWKENVNGHISSNNLHLIENKIVFDRLFGASDPSVIALNQGDGKKEWSLLEADLDGGGGYSLFGIQGDFLAICSSHEISVINHKNGQKIWRTDIQDNGGSGSPRAALINGMIYHEHARHQLVNTASLVRKYITSPGKWDTLFSITPATSNNYHPSFESYSIWVKPDGDSLLLFQNRQTQFIVNGKERCDLYAFNLRTRQVEWRKDSVSATGNSGTGQILIDGDRAFFRGDVSLLCFDPLDRKKIWQKEFNQTPSIGSESFLPGEILIHDGKLLTKPNNRFFYALDPATGKEIWKHTDSGASPESMTVYKELAFFPSWGRTDIYVHRVSDGKRIAVLESPIEGNPDFPEAAFQTAIAIDEKTGRLFCHDGYFVYCYEIKIE